MTCSHCGQKTRTCGPCTFVWGHRPAECLCGLPLCKDCWNPKLANELPEPAELKHRSQEVGLFG